MVLYETTTNTIRREEEEVDDRDDDERGGGGGLSLIHTSIHIQFTIPSTIISLSHVFLSFPLFILCSAQLLLQRRRPTTSFLLQLLCVGEFVWVIELLYDDVELESSSSQFFYSNGEFMTVY